MRIAYVTTDPGIPPFGTKGASIHVQEMLRAFVKLGHEITLFSPRLSEASHAQMPGVQLRPLPSAPSGGEAEARSAWALATNHTVGAVLAAEGPFELIYERHALFAHAAMEFAARHGLPGVLELNAPLIEEQESHRQLAQRSEAVASARRAFGAAGLVIAVSPAAADYARAYGAHPSKVVVEPNGVDASRFAEKPAKRGPFTVGFTGTLKPWHDTATLIEAFAILRRDHVPDARLLIVGDGPERARIDARLGDLGLAEATQFTGAVPASEVPVWLARMHAATAPYHGDRPFYFSPLKLYEYMAAALPVVASDVGDLAQVLDHGRLGRLVPPDDAEALAADLARLAADPDLRDRLGAAARAQVVAHHGWDMIAARVLGRALGTAREVA
jgi:glycosyltransferase involved in cell wall biosynthesis